MNPKILFSLILLSFFASRTQAQKKSAAQPDPLGIVKAETDKQYAYLETLYKKLHAEIPELSFHEEKTAACMAGELRKLGFEVTENVGGYGVVGVLKNGEGPTLLIRADMDALPINEKTGLAYASKVTTRDDAGNEVSVMHGCGHDVHMTVWVGTAQMLASLKDRWQGTVIMVGQPAEERAGGAKAMLAEDLYKKFPKPDYALALHVNANLAAGTVGYCPEYVFANVDMVDITVYGQGGHGAYPHTTIDPVVLAAEMVMAFQTIVSREIAPTEPAVVTVGSIHGGTKHNIISDEVKLQLTLRSYSDEVREQTIEALRRISRGLAIAAGLPESKMPVVSVGKESTPATYNDPAFTERVTKAMQAAIGNANVIRVAPVMGGEDFGLFGKTPEKVPVCIYWLGAVDPAVFAKAQKGELELPSLHSAFFAPLPESTIKTGVVTMTAAALDVLMKPAGKK